MVTRDTVVETDYLSPTDSAIYKERDVARSCRKVTQGGSSYYQRTAHHTRRIHGKEGSDFVEHDTSVESDNMSMSDGK